MSNGTVIFHVSEDYLMHHGIPGQKWGKRNGPPYPLDEKDYSAEEKKAKAKEAKKLAKNMSLKDVVRPVTATHLIYETSPNVINAANKMNDITTKYVTAYEKVRDEYTDKAVENYIKKNPDNKLNRFPDLFDKEDYDRLRRDVREIVYGEEDAITNVSNDSDLDPFQLFLKDMGTDYDHAQAEYFDARRQLKTQVENYVDEILGSYGDMKLKGIDRTIKQQYSRWAPVMVERDRGEAYFIGRVVKPKPNVIS